MADRCGNCARWMPPEGREVHAAPCRHRSSPTAWDHVCPEHWPRKAGPDDPARVLVLMQGGGVARVSAPASSPEDRIEKRRGLLLALEDRMAHSAVWFRETAPGSVILIGGIRLGSLNMGLAAGILEDDGT